MPEALSFVLHLCLQDSKSPVQGRSHPSPSAASGQQGQRGAGAPQPRVGTPGIDEVQFRE